MHGRKGKVRMEEMRRERREKYGGGKGRVMEGGNGGKEEGWRKGRKCYQLHEMKYGVGV